jgi:hypothetical protein
MGRPAATKTKATGDSTQREWWTPIAATSATAGCSPTPARDRDCGLVRRSELQLDVAAADALRPCWGDQRDSAGVVEDVGDLVRGEPEVDRRPIGVRAATACQQFREDEAA